MNLSADVKKENLKHLFCFFFALTRKMGTNVSYAFKCYLNVPKKVLNVTNENTRNFISSHETYNKMTMNKKERLLQKACREANVTYVSPKCNPTKQEEEERLTNLHCKIAKKRAKILLRLRIERKLKSSRMGREILLCLWMLKQQARRRRDLQGSSPELVQSFATLTQTPVVSFGPDPVASRELFMTQRSLQLNNPPIPDVTPSANLQK